MKAIAFSLLVTLASLSRAPRIDIAEVNTLYNEQRQPRFTQLILWDRQGTEIPHVRFWCMADEGRMKAIYRTRDGLYRVTFRDSSGNWRQVDARRVRRTHTLVDPEVEDHDDWPPQIRWPIRY